MLCLGAKYTQYWGQESHELVTVGSSQYQKRHREENGEPSTMTVREAKKQKKAAYHKPDPAEGRLIIVTRELEVL